MVTVSMLDVHAEALDSANAPYHEFLLAYKASERIVYGFVEGKDDPNYYKGLIENAIPTEWRVRLIGSGNRNKVLTVLEGMDWNRFAKTRVCFFVDRDITQFIPAHRIEASNLYITDNSRVPSSRLPPAGW